MVWDLLSQSCDFHGVQSLSILWFRSESSPLPDPLDCSVEEALLSLTLDKAVGVLSGTAVHYWPGDLCVGSFVSEELLRFLFVWIFIDTSLASDPLAGWVLRWVRGTCDPAESWVPEKRAQNQRGEAGEVPEHHGVLGVIQEITRIFVEYPLCAKSWDGMQVEKRLGPWPQTAYSPGTRVGVERKEETSCEAASYSSIVLWLRASRKASWRKQWLIWDLKRENLTRPTFPTGKGSVLALLQKDF